MENNIENNDLNQCRADAVSNKDEDAMLLSNVQENVESRPSRKTDSVFEGFSRIERDEDESIVLNPRVHFELSFDDEIPREIFYDFSCMIELQPYLVSIYKIQENLFAVFFALATGVSKVKRLGSAWKYPPVVETEAKEAWYRENIASVLLKSRGPEATPKRPPKRQPPQREDAGVSGSSDQTSKLEEDLYTMNERLKQMERSSKQEQECHQVEVIQLREQLNANRAILVANAERFSKLSDEYEGRLADWRKRFMDSQSHSEVSQQEWKGIIAQREADLAHVRAESAVEIEKMKIKLSEMQSVISTAERPLEITPSKRQKIENRIWMEAEKVLALAQADLKEMTTARVKAEKYAEDKKREALEAIGTCEKITSVKISELLLLKHQYDSLTLEKQGLELSLKDSNLRCSSFQQEIIQLKAQLEHQKAVTDDLVKEFTGLIQSGGT